MGLESHAAIRTTHWEILRRVIGGVQRLSRSEEENDVPGRLNWRWQCVLHTMAFSDIEELGHRFAGNATQHSSRTPAAPAPAPVPAPALAPAPGLATSAATLPRVSSAIKQRRLARLDAAGHGNVHLGTRGGIRPVTHQVALQQELLNYRSQNVEADVCGFSLPGFWLRKSEPMLAQGTGELAAAPYLPHFALLAHLYHGVEETSCQAERNFSSLSVLIGTSRASLRIHLRWSRLCS